MRTNTAVIVAMLEAINEGLADESMTQMVMESGYLLDIFDRSMSICFNHVFGKEESSQTEELELSVLIDLFITNAVPKDGSCEAETDVPEGLRLKCEPFALKNLLQVLLHESALAAQGKFTVSYSDHTLTMTPEGGFYENPPVFEIFRDILEKQKISMRYDNISINLRFPDESVNC
jgi:hypothetical protein